METEKQYLPEVRFSIEGRTPLATFGSHPVDGALFVPSRTIMGLLNRANNGYRLPGQLRIISAYLQDDNRKRLYVSDVSGELVWPWGCYLRLGSDSVAPERLHELLVEAGMMGLGFGDGTGEFSVVRR